MLGEVERGEALFVALMQEAEAAALHQQPHHLHHAVLRRDVQARVAVYVTRVEAHALQPRKAASVMRGRGGG